ncbi:alpha/beta hydrolase family protein [Bordetella hinzii CA90 BAL1384]|uniref:alpha/beta hydrolase n=1 Tax=Bordetella hinzii TaxID=103855 RepID=UPI00045A8926|nr:alpha/beta fold hydrolase [Bordetella hinzii]KCB30030.1 alpha/beta hydrolase family protein [Bordetella hinzii CA90 BAL1384]
MTTVSTGILLVHGLGGTRYDLGSLHKALLRAGVPTRALTLPGHGGQPEDLLPVRAEHWCDAVRAQYFEMLKEFDVVHIVGMCMGALLAVELAKQVRHDRGRLVALAPPVFLDGWSTPWYRAVRHLLYPFDYFARRIRIMEEEPFGIKNGLLRAMIKAKFERGENFHYQWVPLAAVKQVDRLRGWVKRGLDRIVCPTLIIHARQDELTSLRSARFLASGITAAPCRVQVLEDSYHMICVDNERDEVARSVLAHLGRDEAAARPGRAARGAGKA